MRKKSITLVILLSLLLLPGCAGPNENISAKADGNKAVSSEMETETISPFSGTEVDVVSPAPAESTEPETVSSEVPVSELLHFVDVYGAEYEVEINPAIEKHSYDLDGFSHAGDLLSYTGDEAYTYRLGVDVSHHQGDIDWKKVKDAGFDFAFIRLGYRGYGKEGNLCLDRQFASNIQNAKDAGLDVGVYFFSQAVNEAEAIEEAEFVLQNLGDYELELPIVYDPESILDDEARTDHITCEQFTKNSIAFCDRVAQSGCEPMLYCNMLWEAYQLDLSLLSDYPVWYADYEPFPQTPYHFAFWQYTNTGRIDGIIGDVDLNIQLIPAVAP